ncbi:cytokinesis protein 3, partial [Nowakowskiella sp. JEL0407]
AFFSYSSIDKDIVHEIAEQFTNRGVRIWLDKTHIEVELNRAMKQGILDSALVVLFISDSYIESEYCELEYNYAKDMKKKLYPVRLSRSRAVLESDPSFLTSGKL